MPQVIHRREFDGTDTSVKSRTINSNNLNEGIKMVPCTNSSSSSISSKNNIRNIVHKIKEEKLRQNEFLKLTMSDYFRILFPWFKN